jgi:hypothetical protein
VDDEADLAQAVLEPTKRPPHALEPLLERLLSKTEHVEVVQKALESQPREYALKCL